MESSKVKIWREAEMATMIWLNAHGDMVHQCILITTSYYDTCYQKLRKPSGYFQKNKCNTKMSKT